jgi:xanthine dehydrogenase YagS FAD-binding subunit
MRPFEWTSPKTLEEASRLLVAPELKPDERPQVLAGGQDLITVLQDGLQRPSRIVNLKGVPHLDTIEDKRQALSVGALVTLTQLAENKTVRERFPGLVEAALSVGSPQIRNLGTVGGNLCQRPRCWYFRLEGVPCLKRGGSECFAATGENKYNAILGGGPSWIVHPSDLAPMLVALGASVTIFGPKGERTIPLQEFFTLPSDGPILRENVLAAGEIVTRVSVPYSPVARRSTYLKFRERESFDFAMASVAAAVHLGSDGRIAEARVVLGGVAPIPWRTPKAEAHLRGKAPNAATLAEAAELALAGAEPLEQNAYKVPLTQTLVRRALAAVAASSPTQG